jgi:hypothetical protein
MCNAAVIEIKNRYKQNLIPFTFCFLTFKVILPLILIKIEKFFRILAGEKGSEVKIREKTMKNAMNFLSGFRLRGRGRA